MPVQLATDSDFENVLKSKEKVVVKYFAGWCGNCRLIAPKFKRSSDDPRFTDVLFVEVDAENNPMARKVAGVDNLPFFAVFKNGTLIEGHATSKIETVEEMIAKIQGVS